jgi:P4 family phage/plasmid primase-like protien
LSPFVPTHDPKRQGSPVDQAPEPSLLLPVLADKHAKGWPEHEIGRPAVYLPTSEAFTRRWSTDAHLAAYSVPAHPRRLARAEALTALAAEGGIPMVLAVFDLDAPDHQATEDWFAEQWPRVDAVQLRHPGLFAYRTRGGYRLVWRLAVPYVLRSVQDAADWRRLYQRWCCYLARAVGLVADPSCADWTRLYRLPHATREGGGAPEELPTWGDPAELGTFEVEPRPEELADDARVAGELAATWKLWAPVAKALGEVGQGGLAPAGGALRGSGSSPARALLTLASGGPLSSGPLASPPVGAPGGLPLARAEQDDRQHRRLEGYARGALARAVDELKATPAGNGRNNVLNAKAYALGRFVGAGLLGVDNVERALLEAARGAGLPEFEARTTLQSGLARGIEQPRLPELPPEPAPPGRLARERAPSSSPRHPTDDSESPVSGERRGRERRGGGERRAVQPLDPWDFNTTDTGNAERMVARHGEDLRYCHPWQKWLAWDGRRWRVDDTAEVRRRAKETARSIYAEAAALAGADQAAEGRRKELGAWARRSEARDRRSAMSELAQSEEGIPVLPEQLDADSWRLNCLNGVVDLRTSKLHPHQRGDLFTKLAPVAYDSGATCPTWLAFLHTIMGGNEELIGFLQRFVGYSLTGAIREHVLVICYGTGHNGKSTFLETVVELLGDYGWQAPPDLLMLKSIDAHPTDMTGLFGVRFAACIETAAGRRLDEARMKALTGGDRITARRMREDYWTFRPTHKLALATNHKPIVATTDYGTWRRQKLVPFTVTIPPEQQDKQLPEKLKRELPGILQWALEGCLAWQRDGLGEAEAIREATESWRDESDPLGGFLATHCELAPRLTVPARELYIRYLACCEANSEEPLKQKPFGQRLAERGFSASKGTGGVRLWKGLRLVHPVGV